MPLSKQLRTVLCLRGLGGIESLAISWSDMHSALTLKERAATEQAES